MYIYIYHSRAGCAFLAEDFLRPSSFTLADFLKMFCEQQKSAPVAKYKTNTALVLAKEQLRHCALAQRRSSMVHIFCDLLWAGNLCEDINENKHRLWKASLGWPASRNYPALQCARKYIKVRVPMSAEQIIGGSGECAVLHYLH